MILNSICHYDSILCLYPVELAPLQLHWRLRPRGSRTRESKSALLRSRSENDAFAAIGYKVVKFAEEQSTKQLYKA